MKKYNPELPTLIFDVDGTIVDNFHENLEIIYNQNKKTIDNIANFEQFVYFIKNNNMKDAFDKFKISLIE